MRMRSRLVEPLGPLDGGVDDALLASGADEGGGDAGGEVRVAAVEVDTGVDHLAAAEGGELVGAEAVLVVAEEGAGASVGTLGLADARVDPLHQVRVDRRLPRRRVPRPVPRQHLRERHPAPRRHLRRDLRRYRVVRRVLPPEVRPLHPALEPCLRRVARRAIRALEGTPLEFRDTPWSAMSGKNKGGVV